MVAVAVLSDTGSRATNGKSVSNPSLIGRHERTNIPLRFFGVTGGALALVVAVVAFALVAATVFVVFAAARVVRVVRFGGSTTSAFPLDARGTRVTPAADNLGAATGTMARRSLQASSVCDTTSEDRAAALV